MSYTVTHTGDTVRFLGILGEVSCRTFELSNVTNTMGDAEVYKVTFEGLYNDGSLRYSVQVQRPNGKFAMLNPNTHRARCSQVLSGLRAEVAQYKLDMKGAK